MINFFRQCPSISTSTDTESYTYEPATKLRTLSKVFCCGWVGGWAKGILEFRFGPNLGLWT